MSVHHWVESDRELLSQLLPEAVVVLPIGAVEQHGPHLPTGTDSILAGRLAELASDRAAASSATDVVLAPRLWFGASEHHVPFGGTLTLRTETMLAVLGDLLSAMAAAGARRVLIVNGHGGNSGLAHAAAAAAAARHEILVAHVDYWRLLGETADADAGPVPGHAGRFETSMILAARPERSAPTGGREDVPAPADPPRVEVHEAARWRAMDGYTDHPETATAELGEHLTEELVTLLSAAIVALAAA